MSLVIVSIGAFLRRYGYESPPVNQRQKPSSSTSPTQSTASGQKRRP
jgi:hypothetical protein